MSLFSEPVLHYLYHNQIPFTDLKMAVIQEMVDADYSGNCLYRKSDYRKRYGNFIELSYGTGEDLVGRKNTTGKLQVQLVS